jgi:hypothetical protein
LLQPVRDRAGRFRRIGEREAHVELGARPSELSQQGFGGQQFGAGERQFIASHLFAVEPSAAEGTVDTAAARQRERLTCK